MRKGVVRKGKEPIKMYLLYITHHINQSKYVIRWWTQVFFVFLFLSFLANFLIPKGCTPIPDLDYPYLNSKTKPSRPAYLITSIYIMHRDIRIERVQLNRLQIINSKKINHLHIINSKKIYARKLPRNRIIRKFETTLRLFQRTFFKQLTRTTFSLNKWRL